jgi:hypothetical protein
VHDPTNPLLLYPDRAHRAHLLVHWHGTTVLVFGAVKARVTGAARGLADTYGCGNYVGSWRPYGMVALFGNG